ncbi:MAG: cation:proton antiporter [Chloroflexota bacterium]|nr:cation:proton antiporter [Chloroflexota bacterium]
MELLLIILVILVLARLAGFAMERIGQAAILGQLLAGIVLGLLVMSFPGALPHFVDIGDNPVFNAITDLGIFFLMLMAGMEMRLEQLAEASRRGAVVALGGILLPLAAGFLMGWLWLPDSEYKVVQSLFLGIVISITSVAVSTGILINLGQLRTKLGNTTVSAAIIDDVIGLVLLAVLVSIIEIGGAPSGAELGILGAKIAGFFLLAFLVGRFVVPPLGAMVHRVTMAEVGFSVALVLALLLGVTAELLGMHFIIGAFTAGLLVNDSTFGESTVRDIQERVSGITLGFLAPIFFASIGLGLDLSSLGTALPFVTVLVVVAIVTKLVGCGLPARLLRFTTRESLAIGSAMTARGEVALVVATIAAQAGIFAVPASTASTVLFSSVITMAIVTTIVAPIGLRLFLKPPGDEAPAP